MQQRTVLIVDDNPFVSRLITETVEAAGYRPTAVGDSRKAVEIFAACDFDLVITDQRMPAMTGIELARRLRQLKPDIPICLVTGSAGDLEPSEIEEFEGFLEKPFQASELEVLLIAVMGPATNARHVRRPLRYDVNWRVDYFPLASGTLAKTALAPRRATLSNISEHGLAFVADDVDEEAKFCAFLIYPPESGAPSLMVGETRWTEDRAGKRLMGTQSLFWGSEREKDTVLEKAM